MLAVAIASFATLLNNSQIAILPTIYFIVMFVIRAIARYFFNRS
ncbi:hypothetical protein [Cyanobacterium sp. HL-69]